MGRKGWSELFPCFFLCKQTFWVWYHINNAEQQEICWQHLWRIVETPLVTIGILGSQGCLLPSAVTCGYPAVNLNLNKNPSQNNYPVILGPFWGSLAPHFIGKKYITAPNRSTQHCWWFRNPVITSWGWQITPLFTKEFVHPWAGSLGFLKHQQYHKVGTAPAARY